jgi:hypothetical protein
MAFIRKTKTSSGATAVQIARKRYGELIIMEHLGSAETEEGIKKLVEKGRKKLAEGQKAMFDLDKLKI